MSAEPPPGATVLLVEDDLATRHEVGAFLRGHGFRVVGVGDVAAAWDRWGAQRPDLVVLDLGLPDADGSVLIRRMRRDATTPILVLSARDREADKVAALEAGADDYVTKPFGMDELLARLRAALRRGAPSLEEAAVATDHFVIDLAAKRVSRNGGDVRLTPTEWHLVEVLARNRGKLVTQRQLLDEVWGPSHERDTNYLRVFMAQVRRKLEPEPSQPRYFITEPGMGYRFELT